MKSKTRIFSEKNQINLTELILLSINTFALTFIVAKFAVMKYGLIRHNDLTAAAASLLLTAIFVASLLKSIHFQEGKPLRIDYSLIAITISAISYIFFIYRHGVTLPANDPIADPTFGSIISRGILLNQYYTAGQSGYAYPPGVPLLLSVIFKISGTIGALAVFKSTCLLAVALMPLSWAYSTKHIFNLKLPLGIIAALFYVGAFGFERTLNYALPFAGKNSQIIMLSIFPLFLIQFKKSLDASYLTLACTGIAFAGLIFIHYSAIHLAAAIIGSIFLASTYRDWNGLKDAKLSFFRFLAVGILGPAIFLFLFPESLRDPRSTLGASTQFYAAAHTFFITLISPNESALAIFNHPAFQKIGSPARGFLLFSSVLFSWVVSKFCEDNEMDSDAENILIANSCFFTAIIIAVAFGSGLINVGASLDFSRWFIFPAQFAVFGCGALSGFLLLRKLPDRRSALACAASFLILPAVIFYSDAKIIKNAAPSGVLSKKQILSLQHIFGSTLNKCYILAPNMDAGGGMLFAQKYRPLEYVEAATGCVLANGSWVHGPYPGWRSATGLPKPTMFPPIQMDVTYYFVGTAAELEGNYASLHWTKISNLQGTNATIWKLF